MDIRDIAQEFAPKSMAARDWVFQVIRTAIVRGALPEGMPLRQDEISSALNVSHIPVREAFRQLEAQGLVRIYPNRGAYVTKLSRQDLSNLMDIRIMLELGALRAAVPMLTDETINKGFAIHERERLETDTDQLDELNHELHFLLYAAAGNPILLDEIDRLHANIDRHIRPFYADAGINEKSKNDHDMLLAAVRARDIELATAVLRTHLELTKSLVTNVKE